MGNLNDRVLIQFNNDKQAKAFFKWFCKRGFDHLLKETKTQFGCITSEEKPGATSDENAYFLEIE